MERGWSDRLGAFRQHYESDNLDAAALLIPILGFLPPDHHRFLRRLVAALHLVFHLAGPAGILPLTRFLEMSQLDRFVASSFSAQQALAVRLEGLLVRYADEEQPRLAATMAAQTSTACLDENFHGDRPCLVAVEPRSNFLLLESYRPQRDGDTWAAALGQALASLQVEVIQVTSDQAEAKHRPLETVMSMSMGVNLREAWSTPSAKRLPLDAGRKDLVRGLKDYTSTYLLAVERISIPETAHQESVDRILPPVRGGGYIRWS
jgi:hypothetical protein